MALTVGTGPFGQHPAGSFQLRAAAHTGLIYFEDSPRRMRAMFAGATVVDSTHAKLLHEHGKLPVHYFPESEVRSDLLVPTDHHTHCPWKGDASYWSVRVGDQVAENAVWSYPEPLDDAPPLRGYMAVYWNSMDGWLEEDEAALGHARATRTTASTCSIPRGTCAWRWTASRWPRRRARAIFEAGLPTRWYIPLEDVRADLLEESDKRTVCAYKGVASYRSVRTPAGREEDIVWLYEDPHRDVARIAGYLFFNERVDIHVDGELQERPATRWSPRELAGSRP